MRLFKGILLIAVIFVISFTIYIQNKPKVLIIGDSISIGYTPFVKKKLKKKARIYHNPGNAQHTGTGLEKIHEWIGDKKWDIVQFNWGLWDLYYRNPNSKIHGNRYKEKRKITCTIDEYASNLDSIVTILQTITDAKLIFVSTTYVPDNAAGRFKNDAIRYNDAAKKIMNKHSVLVNDIYEQSTQIHEIFGKGLNDVHYSKEGYEKLSEPVSKFLFKELESMKSN